MKQKLLLLLTGFLLVSLLIPLRASAYDFKVDGIYYNILSSTDKTVEVSYNGLLHRNYYTGDVVIPYTVTHEATTYTVRSIGSCAFEHCSSLTSVDIPSSVNRIKTEAFFCCSGLTSITIPSSVKTIDKYAFYGCSGLVEVVYLSMSSVSYDTYLFENSSSKKIYCYKSVRNSTCNFEKLLASTDNRISSMKLKEDASLIGTHTLTDIVITDKNGNTISRDAEGYYNVPTHTATVSYLFDGHPVSYELESTANPTIRYNTKSTQTTVTVTVNVTVDETCSVAGITVDGQEVENGGSVTFNYAPDSGNEKGNIHVETTAGAWDTPIRIMTNSMGQKLVVTPGVAKATATGSYVEGDATVEAFGFVSTENGTDFDGQNERVFDGLNPGWTYNFYYGVKVAENSYAYYATKTVKLPALTWETGTARATSKTSAQLFAETNCDAESGTGFEWRRIDAPDIVPSTVVGCPVVEGAVTGSLRNLDPTAYYKYRPFYTSASGKTYYGDWVGFFTGDADVYFEPEVRTYGDVRLTQNRATVRGYALAGTDDISEQGFEYWPAGQPSSAAGRRAEGQRKRVTASGILMTATFDDLSYSTTYRYRAYVTTAAGTFYGDEVEFTTGEDLSGIEAIHDDTDPQTLTVAVRENPATGTAWLKVDGATSPTVPCQLVSLSGAVVATTTISADGSWQPLPLDVTPGLYLLTVSDASGRSTLRLIVR